MLRVVEWCGRMAYNVLDIGGSIYIGNDPLLAIWICGNSTMERFESRESAYCFRRGEADKRNDNERWG